LGFIVWLIAVGLFCWVAAHWIWRLAEPKPSPIPVKENANWSSAILSGPALGFARVEAPAAQQAAATPSPELRVRLMGLAREPAEGSHHSSRALLKVDNKRVLWLKAGDELEPGVTLAAIDADAVRIVRDGRETRLPLREPRPPAPRGTPAQPGMPAPGLPPVASVAPKPADTCKLTPEQRNRAYVLRPEIIDGVMRERNGWTDLFKPAGVGLAVQNPGGTGAMLGLYGNDILMKADGAQIGSVDDVMRLVLEPLARNESVVVTGARSGQPREWIYAGVNCLAR
jgi:hypothetical protein